MEFKYRLNSKKKFKCPSCQQYGKYVRYIDITTGEYIDEKYGKCDRMDSCGYHERPPAEFIEDNEHRVIDVEEKHLLDSNSIRNYDGDHWYSVFRENKTKIPNTFLRAIGKKFGREAAEDVYDRYYLATWYDGGVIFPYIYNGDLRTGKIMFYDQTLHRDKNFGNYPRWMHNYGYGNVYKQKNGETICNMIDHEWFEVFPAVLPLFGWDLIAENPGQPICVVESEKSAVICSIVFPGYTWVATGGLYGLQNYKFPFYANCKWWFFPDLGLMKGYGMAKDYWQKRVADISVNLPMVDMFIDYLPPNITEDQKRIVNELQLDIADFILDGGQEYIEFMKKKLYVFK